MNEQTALFDVLPKPKKEDKAKRTWERKFQKWSDNASLDGSEPYGSCGFGAICDYCTDSSYGRPCVRALNAMCRERRKTIDYEKTSFIDAWEGAL